MVDCYLRFNILWVSLTLKCCRSRTECFVKLVEVHVNWSRNNFTLNSDLDFGLVQILYGYTSPFPYFFYWYICIGCLMWWLYYNIIIVFLTSIFVIFHLVFMNLQPHTWKEIGGCMYNFDRTLKIYPLNNSKCSLRKRWNHWCTIF